MSCVTSRVCNLGSRTIGGLITLKIHVCSFVWKFSEAFIHNHPVKCLASAMISWTGSYSRQFFKACTAYATCGLLDHVYEMCSVHLIYFMFCGLGQHSGYSDCLWAAQGCGIYHPPLSSAEVKESVELYLYSPWRPWLPVVKWNLFSTFLLFFYLFCGQYNDNSTNCFVDRVVWTV